jgi:hypothetical protein
MTVCLFSPTTCPYLGVACTGQGAKVKKKLLDMYGWECACCGEDNPHFLCLDHIDETGAQHRAEIMGPRNQGSKGGWPYWSKIIRLPFNDNLQILCYNCNNGKRYFGVCPHQVKETLTSG